ncbi:MAG TPA: ATP-binding protein [Candidatus Binatia bacterium]|nr:ATP-binding protein [Candidatus Binatia bacterium]
MVAGWRAAGRLGRHHVAHRIEAAWVDGDETRLEQIVSNLLNNALRFTPEGGTVTIRVRTEGTDAVLEVDDSGVGIPADAIGRVFDPFFQGERGPDRAQGGLGIGLTLVRRLVQLHGGSVAASSEGPGCGSVFTVRLPLIAPPPPAEDGGTGPRHAPRRILIIEDHVDSREMLRLALEREGHTVVEAATAYDGLQAARRAAPDIVLVDIGLPEIDGYEVARRLRAALGSAVILVALTGYGAQEDRRRGEEAGFDAHLVKPVDPARLLALITASPGRRP